MLDLARNPNCWFFHAKAQFLHPWLTVEVCPGGQLSSLVALSQMSRLVGKPAMWFPNRSDTNRPAQSQKQARTLKEVYYPCSKTKAVISFAVIAKLICVFVFAYADCWFSHEAAQMISNSKFLSLLESKIVLLIQRLRKKCNDQMFMKQFA